MKKKDTIRFSITVTPELNQKLEELYDKEQRSKTNLISFILEKFFETGGGLKIFEGGE